MKQLNSNFGADRVCRMASRVTAMVALIIGILVLLGWAFDIATLKSVVPGWMTMKANTALCFVLLGGALWLMQGKSPDLRTNRIAQVCAGVAVLIGALTLGECLVGWNCGTDVLLFKDTAELGTAFPGRMAATSALNIVMLGSALLLLGHERFLLVRVFVYTAALLAYLALVGYIFDSQEFHIMAPMMGMAMHGALLFLLLSVGVLSASRDVGILALIGSESTDVFVRRLLPAALFTPLVLGWLRLLGQRMGLYETEFGVEMLVVGNTLIFVALIVWSARTVHGLDARRVHAEAEFEHERYLLRSLMDHVPDRIYFKDNQSRFMRNNQAHLARFGLTDPSQVIGKTDFDFFTEEHARQAFEDEKRVMETGEPLTIEEMETWPDDTESWALSTKMRLEDENGRVIGTFGISHDITERKREEKALKLMSNRLVLATHAAAIGIWDFDPVNNELIWDEQMFRIFGVTPDQFTGNYEAWQATVHPDDLAREKEKVQMALTGEKEFDSEFRIIWSDKSIRYIKADALVQRDDSGKAIHMIGTNWDITEQKHAEQALARTAAELTRSNADLAQFASVASHDLQEPLRAVAGCVELLAKGYQDKLDADAKVLIQHTLEGARRMQTLIHDLLEYSRVATRNNQLDLTDSNAALDLALANLSTALSESDTVITRDRLPTVTANLTQLAQLFQNLIGNGLKFRSAQRPEIHIGAQQKNDEWVFSVRDNGIGIESQYRERIFEIFQRLHTRTEYPGTGIGLAICRRIVDRHGGRIWVDSGPGKGSTFYFTLHEAPKPNS
ncbi:MAG: ATP-binding protein [Luteolibacter sp.]